MSAANPELRAFIARLHFLIGLFVGPFLLVAAFTGTLYVLTPQIENALYRDVLRTDTTGPAHSLEAQAEAARALVGPAPRLSAVRPAIAPGHTTRVLFAQPGLGDSESRAVFVDPVTLAIRGDLTVYGTTGVLPFRTALDYLHSNLMLGAYGRAYSELAASWLWIMALGGVLLWLWRRTGRLSRQNPANRRLRTRRLHGLIGVTVSLGLLFLSASGLTWSQWAGGRIGVLRAEIGWVTPSVSLALPADATDAARGSAGAPGAQHAEEHAGHHASGAAMPATAASPALSAPVPQLDAVLAVARAAGINSPLVELRLPRSGQAWVVREFDRNWPTQADTVAIDPRTLAVTDRADFADFPLVAKLIRWGIDLHMGLLFGLASQVLMAATGVGLIAATLYGYRIWWQNRPAPGAPPRTLLHAFLRLSLLQRGSAVAVALALGWALPVAGVSLIGFLAVDVLRWRLSRPDPRALPAE
ncbi:PepSY domain-containing protein [Roseomonas gilardii subsp. gilardii]|uniref:PepSY-associated TM helix domain-containing protein n=1 Tax=Roseomonas gilardii TaxID=257708 RepID=UPI001FF92C0C|nr:PepSY-associated TM helix domain-containing protein [Roseomonas gilardii]UPG71138.1 PepSY domain-containing protein [Roseomonas gilardii subsp. gilardii]